MYSKSCQLHMESSYQDIAHPYQEPSTSLAAFNRASKAVMQTLSWPESKFLKWAKSDVDKAVAAAEEDLAFLDHVSQQSVTSNGAQDTFEASMENGLSIHPKSSSTLKSSQVVYQNRIRKRWTSLRQTTTTSCVSDTPLPVIDSPLQSWLTQLAHLMLTYSGSCPFGSKCRFGRHDANKIAICPSVLRGIECVASDKCGLSHNASPERTPYCVFHLKSSCSREGCPYIHSAVDPDAFVCTDFALMGYCQNGSACKFLHLRHCPDYSNSGHCTKARCYLPHVDMNSQRVKQASTSDSLDAMTPTWHEKLVRGSVSGQGGFIQQKDFIPL